VWRERHLRAGGRPIGAGQDDRREERGRGAERERQPLRRLARLDRDPLQGRGAIAERRRDPIAARRHRQREAPLRVRRRDRAVVGRGGAHDRARPRPTVHHDASARATERLQLDHERLAARDRDAAEERRVEAVRLDRHGAAPRSEAVDAERAGRVRADHDRLLGRRGGWTERWPGPRDRDDDEPRPDGPPVRPREHAPRDRRGLREPELDARDLLAGRSHELHVRGREPRRVDGGEVRALPRRDARHPGGVAARLPGATPPRLERARVGREGGVEPNLGVAERLAAGGDAQLDVTVARRRRGLEHRRPDRRERLRRAGGRHRGGRAAARSPLERDLRDDEEGERAGGGEDGGEQQDGADAHAVDLRTPEVRPSPARAAGPRRAWDARTVRRHAAVSTSFAISGGEPSRSGGPQKPVPRET
jgi:hypothetical protein